jgi:hypothetical protein
LIAIARIVPLIAVKVEVVVSSLQIPIRLEADQPTLESDQSLTVDVPVVPDETMTAGGQGHGPPLAAHTRPDGMILVAIEDDRLGGMRTRLMHAHLGCERGLRR